MAENVKIGVSVDDGGSTKKLVKDANELRTSYEGAAKAASSIKASAAAPAGTAGSRRAAEMSGTEYGRARGATEATGASARDFANQAQGLGGLVRLYATYAANIFAVGAAFNALSRAMDTTNMIRGLDQLGAATGRNLGTLSKRVEELTGGAVSLREAMTVVAQSTGAGMTSQQVERLAGVAKTASQALGVSMPDALNRLSRGITKLEPELLDELGLFTKIGPATEAYARSVGKTAAQLTDFERRQAFANAVLKEGEDKFGAISLQANSYDKLLASLKNIVQSGLEVVNKVLGPIIEALASSPTALAAAIGIIGVTLVKQALPALGQFKQGFARAAEESRAVAIQKAKDAQSARDSLDKLTIDKLDDRLALEVMKVKQAEDKMSDARVKGWAKNTAVAKLASTDIENVTKEQVAKALAATDRAEAAMKQRAAKGTLAGDDLAQEQKRIALTREYISVIDKAAQSYTRAAVDENKLNDSRKNAMRGYSVASLTMRAAAEAERRAIMSNIVSNAAYNGSLIGVVGALKLARAAFTEANVALTRFEVAMLAARTTIAAVGGALSTLGAAFNKLLGVIGIITTIASLLDMGFSKASKEINVAEDAIDKLGKASEGAERTLENLARNGSKRAVTIDGIVAASNAMGELSSSAQEAVKATQKAKDAMGGWDRIKDSFFSLFGGGLENNLAENLTTSIQKAIGLARVAGRGAEAEATIAEALGLKNLGSANIAKEIARVVKEGGTEGLVKGLEAVNKNLASGRGAVEDYKTSLSNTKLQFEQFIQSTANSDPLFKLGVAFQDLGMKMSNALTGSVEEINAAFLELQKNPLVASMLGDKVVKAMINLQDFDKQVAQAKEWQSAVQETQDKISNLTQQYLDKPIASTESLNSDLARAYEIIGKGSKEYLDPVVRKLAEAKLYFSELRGNPVEVNTKNLEIAKNALASGLQEAFKAGGAYIEQALGNAREKAQMAIQRANLAGLSDVERAKEETKLRNREIDIRVRGIQVNISLILGQARLTAAIEEATAEAKLRDKPDDELAKARLDSAKIVSEVLSKQGKTGSSLTTNAGITAAVRAAIGALNLGDVGNLAQSMAQSTLQGPGAGIAAQNAALELASGEKVASNLQGRYDLLKASTAEKVKQLETEAKFLDVSKQSLDTVIALVGEQNIGLITQRQSLEASLAAKRNKIEETQAEAQLQAATISKNEETIKLRTRELQAVRDRQAAESDVTTQKNTNELIAARAAIRQRELEIVKAQAELQNALRSSEFELAQTRESSMANMLGMSQLYMTYLSARQSVEKAIFDQELQANEIRRQSDAKQAETTAKINELRAKQADLGLIGLVDPNLELGITALQEQLAREGTLRDIAIARTQIQVDKAKQLADINKKAADEQERYNLLLENSVILADHLKGAFGDVGEKMGNLTKALTEVAIEQEKNTKAVSLAKQKYDEQILVQQELGMIGIDNSKEIGAAEKVLAKEQDKQRKAEIKGQGQILAAAKGMFKEKTAAFKILAAAEKAHHAISLALNIKEMIAKVTATQTVTAAKVGAEATQTATEEAGFFARLPAYISSIYAKTIGQLGPIAGPVVAAGLVAAVLSMMGGGGGDSFSGPAAITAEQRQEVQGTAMGYDAQGNLTQVRSGVLGDTMAKNAAIANGIEIISATSVAGLEFDNKMLKALQSIDRGIGRLAASLFRTTGLISGTSFGTMEGTQGGGKDIFSFLFGSSSTSTEIIDSGLQFAGTLKQLSTSAENFVNVFETVKTTTTDSGGILGFITGGGGTSTSVDTQVRRLAEIAGTPYRRAARELKKIFTGMVDTVEEVGRSIIGDSQAATDYIQYLVETIRIDPNSEGFASLRGLKGDELATQLQAVFGTILATVFEKFIPQDILDEFQLVGEDTATTLIRLADSNTKIIKALSNINLGIDTAALVGSQFDLVTPRTGVFNGITNIGNAVLARTNYTLGNIEQAITTATVGALMANDVSSWYESISVALSGREAVFADIRRVLGQSVVDAIAGDLSKLDQSQLAQLKQAGATWINSITTAVGEEVYNGLRQSTAEFTFTQELINLLGNGDIEKALEPLQFYFENFLSESEQLAPTAEALRKELNDLGFGFVDTTEEFKAAVASIDKIADPETFADLILLADEFVQVYGNEVSKAEDLRLELLKLEGKTTEALNAQRQKEFDTLSEGEKILQAQIWALQDSNELRKLDTALLQAQGLSYQVLIRNREDELRLLTQEQKLKKLAIYQQEDANRTLSLQIRLLKAVGLVQQAVNLEREQELNQYSDTDRALLGLIYSFEDAVGAADNLKKSLQDTTTSIKSQIKQLQDYKKQLLGGDKSILTTLEKYTNAKQEVDRLTGIILSAGTSEKDRNDAINSLTSASDQFLTLSRSLYSSSEVYSRDFNNITSLLDSVTGGLGEQLTDAERQLNAVESSATFLGKIDESTADTATLLDRYLTNLQTFLTNAANAPSNIVASLGPAIAQAIDSYRSITGTTLPTPVGTASTGAQSVQDYAQIYNPTASGLAQDTASTTMFSAPSTTTPPAQDFVEITYNQADSFAKELYASIGREATGAFAYTMDGLDYWRSQLTNTDNYELVKDNFQNVVRDLLTQDPNHPLAQHIRSYWTQQGLPGFATGVDALSRDMIAQVHQGERIISAPENAEITRAFTNKDETNRELLNEIKKLNQKVESLERTVAEGAVINVEATDRNTQQISRSVEQAGQAAVHTEAIRRRTTVV